MSEGSLARGYDFNDRPPWRWVCVSEARQLGSLLRQEAHTPARPDVAKCNDLERKETGI